MRSDYRACAEISLDALEHNMKSIKNLIGVNTKLMCVIKTNAYGHGSTVIAKELVKMGADGFAVATLEEGIELRKNGITAPILVLGYIMRDQYEEMLIYNITPSVFTYGMAKDMDYAAEKMGKVLKVHIQIDTGMSRLGFLPEEMTVQRICMMHNLFKNISIEGIYTHFPCADCGEDDMTEAQLNRFLDIIEKLEEKNVHIPIKHCSNSACIMRYPNAGLNMVRAGIILYGLYPSDEIDESLISIKPLMTLKSRVIHVKTVAKGTTVGYGATFVCQRETAIATISIGYGDGYPRALSNQGRVLIGNQSYPIIGRICMDQFMVDITDAEESINSGDEVILIGQHGSERITVEEVAAMNHSFNYEFVCDINRRVPRVYVKNGEICEVVDYLLQ